MYDLAVNRTMSLSGHLSNIDEMRYGNSEKMFFGKPDWWFTEYVVIKSSHNHPMSDSEKIISAILQMFLNLLLHKYYVKYSLSLKEYSMIFT